MHAWIDEMSSAVKAVDPLHMLTIGQEGAICARGAALSPLRVPALTRC